MLNALKNKNKARIIPLWATCLSVLGVTCLLGSPILRANPLGANIVNGTVSIDATLPGVMNITNSPNAIINWQGFDIGQHEITRFIQQSSQSAVLNRVLGSTNPSQILGQLLSNGRVFLINPNGIIFGAGARVDTAGMIASSLNLSNQDFLNGNNFLFTAGDGAGSISNQGIIHAGKDGNIVLIAPDINNEGTISSDGGQIVLAAGEQLTITSLDDPDISYMVQAPDNEVINVGQLLSQGGAIDLFAGQIFHSGVISANSAEVDDQGRIRLVAQDFLVLDNQSKTLADNSVGQGGTIHLLGDRVGLTDQALVSATGESGGGQVLVGGDYQGANPAIKNAQITYVGSEVEIHADAITEGDGGKIILWSDGATYSRGTLTARAGIESGDGGFIETSGHYLEVGTVAPDASAPNGAAGTWLLDPEDVSVEANPEANITTTPVVGDFGTSFFLNPTVEPFASTVIDVATVNSALDAGNNVFITTASGGGSGADLGNITVNAAITKTADGGAGDGSILGLDADNNIIIKQEISSTAGILDVSLVAENAVIIEADILTNGGDLNVGDGDGTVKSITQNAGVLIDTRILGDGNLTNAGDIEFLINGGTTTGNITVDQLIGDNIRLDISGSNDALGSGIFRSSSTSLITANQLFLDVHGFLNEFIGTDAEPLRVSVNNLEAHLDTGLTAPTMGGIFIESLQDITIGGVDAADSDFFEGLRTHNNDEVDYTASIKLNVVGDIITTERIQTSFGELMDGTDGAGSIDIFATGGILLNGNVQAGAGGDIRIESTLNSDFQLSLLVNESITASSGDVTIIAPRTKLAGGTTVFDSSIIRGNLIDITASRELELKAGSALDADAAIYSEAGDVTITTANLLLELTGATNGDAVIVANDGTGDGNGDVIIGQLICSTCIPLFDDTLPTTSPIGDGTTDLGVYATNFLEFDAGAESSEWNTALNWSQNRLPTATDNLYITTGDVDISSGNQLANNIYATANLNILGGSLAVSGYSDFLGTFKQSVGTSVSFFSDNNTLRQAGLELNGTVNIITTASSNSELEIIGFGGVTNNGTIILDNTAGGESRLVYVPDKITNTSTIQSIGLNGGDANIINTGLVNQGLLDVDHDLILLNHHFTGGGPFIEIDHNSSLANGSTLDIAADQFLNVIGGTFTWDGGLITGSASSLIFEDSSTSSAYIDNILNLGFGPPIPAAPITRLLEIGDNNGAFGGVLTLEVLTVSVGDGFLGDYSDGLGTTLQLNSGILDVFGYLDISDDSIINMDGGTLNFNDGGFFTGIYLYDGTINLNTSGMTATGVTGNAQLFIDNGDKFGFPGPVATLNVNWVAGESFHNFDITNYDTLNIIGGAVLGLDGNSQVTNAWDIPSGVKGVIDFQGAGTILDLSGTTNMTNDGLVLKTGAGNSVVDTPFTNSGDIDVQAGLLDFQDDLIHLSGSLKSTTTNGLITSSHLEWQGGSLDLDVTTAGLEVSGAVTLNNTLTLTGSGSMSGTGTITGTGLLDITSPSGIFDLQDDGQVDVLISNAGLIKKTGGTTTIVSQDVTNTGTIDVQAGEIDIQATLTQSGSSLISSTGLGSMVIDVFNWQGGLVSVPLSVNTLAITGPVTLNDSLTLNGVGSLSGLGTIAGTGDVDIALAGTLDLQNDEQIAVAVSNAGILKKTAGTGISSFLSGVTNSGDIDAQIGTIDITGGLTQLAGSLGSSTGDGTITYDTLDWQGGSMDIDLTVDSIDISGPVVLNSTLTLTGNGTLNGGSVSGSGMFQIASTGFFDLQTDGTISTTLDNLGTILKSGGTGTTGPDFGTRLTAFNVNNGTIEIDSGIFGVDDSGGFVNNGTIDLAAGTVIQHYSTAIPTIGPEGTVFGIELNNLGTISGFGQINGTLNNFGTLTPGASPGVLSIAGNLNLTSTSNLFLDIEGLVQGSQYDFIDVSGATSLGGNVTVMTTSYSGQAFGDVFNFIDSSSVSGSFDGVNFGSGPFYLFVISANSMELLAVSGGAPGSGSPVDLLGSAQESDIVVLTDQVILTEELTEVIGESPEDDTAVDDEDAATEEEYIGLDQC
jgi:filamentous hemagglutinin family protein